MTVSPAPRLSIVVLALFSVYVVWGSTYYAMAIALESLPPFLMAGPRHLIAGVISYAVLRFTGAPRPTKAEWVACAKVGVAMLTIGNGAVAVAEQSVSSSVAAIVVGLTPIFGALYGRLIGEKATGREWIGLVVGFAGVLLLNLGGQLELHTRGLVLLAAPASWAAGSIWGKKLPLPRGPIASAMQMITGGIATLLLAVLTREHLHGPLSTRSLLAVAYLVVFGSLLAFTAYAWLLANVRAPLAMSYAYVNPIVAVLIGWAIGGEPVTWVTLAAAALCVGAVGLIRR